MFSINGIFGFLIIFSIIVAALNGRLEMITTEAVTAAGQGVKVVFELAGIIALWLGVAKVAERSGLLAAVTRLFAPAVRLLFPGVPAGHPALGAILLNLSANLFGFGSAATPFGLKAMAELQKLNRSERASTAMCTLLAINTSSITLIPSTVIALRVSAGSAHPAEILGTTIFATGVSTFIALLLDFLFQHSSR